MSQKKEKEMSKIEQQKMDQEWDIVFPLLQELGITPEQIIEHKDAPDFKIRLSDNSLIGIEVTHYSATRNKETIKVLDKIFSEYIEVLKKTTPVPYTIDLYFWCLDYPSFNLMDNKQEIFKEIDSFIPGHEVDIETKFIEEAVFEPSYDDSSHVDFNPLIEYEDVNAEKLEQRLQVKENLLESYRRKKRNEKVKDYWLVVNFGMEEKADMSNYHLPDNFFSNYQRIYLVDKHCKPTYKLIWLSQQPRP